MLYFRRIAILLCLLVGLGVSAMVSNAQDDSTIDGVYFIGQHHVASWPIWLEVFNEVQTFRSELGNLAETNEIYRSLPHKNYIAVFEPFPDVESALTWATSQDLWEAVIRGTSDSPLHVYLNGLVEAQTPQKETQAYLLNNS